MLQSLLWGVGIFSAIELVLWFTRRRSQTFKPGILFHLAALAAGVWAAFEQTDLIASDPLPWQIFCTFTLVILALALYSLFDTFVLHRPWNRQKGPMVPALVRDVGRLLLVLAVALFAATQIHRLPFPAVLASSTVVSAILALAFQDILKNVFAGMALQLEGWLKVGDWVMIDDQPASVVEMSWRSVKLRNNEGVEFLEPNTEVTDRKLVNYGSGRRPVAFLFFVGLPYETPPALAKEVLLKAARSSPDALAQPEPRAFLREYSDSSIVYALRVWTKQVQRIAVFRDQVNSRVWYEVQREGLYIPFPIRTVHLRDLDRAEDHEKDVQLARTKELLQRAQIFDCLDEEALETLASAARKEQYGHGERLVREGEPGDSLYLIDRGRVLVSKSGDVLETSTIRLATLEAGSFFGEHSLLTGEPRTATVTADGGCEVLVLQKKSLASLLQTDPSLAESLSRALAERDAATVSTLEARRASQTTSPESSEDHEPILKRIRHFFRLPS